jgi:hypothetical protein
MSDFCLWLTSDALLVHTYLREQLTLLKHTDGILFQIATVSLNQTPLKGLVTASFKPLLFKEFALTPTISERGGHDQGNRKVAVIERSRICNPSVYRA